MTAMDRLLKDQTIPVFHRVHCLDEQERTADVAAEVRRQLERTDTLERILPGSRVAITAGSRAIDQLPGILKALIQSLKKIGALPFIVPAMGSHGGETADGQADLLRSLGITERAMGAPVLSTMETVVVGRLVSGAAVHVDKYAAEADFIIPVNRVKPHAEYQGTFESGILKMVAVGLGNQPNAARLHQLGFKDFSSNVQHMARVVLEQCRIPFGIGLVENSNHQIYRIAAIPAELIEIEEPALLQQARALRPAIAYPKIDILIIETMGKDICSTGIDPNVVGRSASFPRTKPFTDRIGVLSLSRHTAGDAYGIGLVDCVTRRLFAAMDYERTFSHAVTTANVDLVRIPPIMQTDEQCLRFLMKTCPGSGATGFRIVWLKNTLDLSEYHVSEGLMLESLNRPGLTVDSGTLRPSFDEKGRFIAFV